MRLTIANIKSSIRDFFLFGESKGKKFFVYQNGGSIFAIQILYVSTQRK
jgi:hypothetical protein